MITLVRGGIVVPRADLALRDAAVAVEGEIVLDIGHWDDLRGRWPEAPVLGGPDRAVIPGLANSHDHGRLSTFDRGLEDDCLEVWRPRQQGMPPSDAYWGSLYYGLQMVEAGVTTLVHHHIGGAPGRLLENMAGCFRAYRELGLRVCFAVPAWDMQRFVYGPDAAFLARLSSDIRAEVDTYWPRPVPFEEVEDATRALLAEASGTRIQVRLGPLGTQWCSESLLRRVKATADRLDLGLHLHLLETPYQRAWADRALGGSKVAALDRWGILDERLTVAHAVWLVDAELDTLAARGVRVSHQPSSNLRLRSGVARVPAMLARGIEVGVGLDGMALDRDDDLFTEVRLAMALGRPPGMESHALTTRDVWRMATEGGTRAALGRTDLGALAPGAPADLVLLDLEALRGPIRAVEHAPVDLLVNRARRDMVRTVMVAGEVLVDEGRHVRVDRERVVASVNDDLAKNGADDRLQRVSSAFEDALRGAYEGWVSDPGWSPPRA